MKKFLRMFLTVVFGIGLSLFAGDQVEVNAASNNCQYTPEAGVNPDYQTMNCLLTEAALAQNVPQEIVKAIAERESGDWRHFDENGKAIVTTDNGIGVMQITNQSQYDQERLKSDIAYNIQAGVETLDRMFKRNDLPTINNKERDVLEHWYFAIMAYNGTKPVNSPVVQATNERNKDAYQEKIYENINKYALIKTTSLPFSRDNFQYDSSSRENITFKTMNYHFNVPFTKSKHHFKNGQKVGTTSEVRLRKGASTDSELLGTLSAGEVLTVTGPFQYDENPLKKNHFVWFPVKRSNGTEGYVASSYLKLKFKDIPSGHYAEKQIDYLVDRGILNGIGNDQFGLEQPLTRWQAVLLITRANNVSLTDRPDPGFVDVPKNHLYYKEIAAAVEEGLFQGLPGNKFNPDATLTRSQMAVVLQRIYEFPLAPSQHPFTDLTDDWYKDSIARLYASGITDGVTKTTFGPERKVTREQFAVFMVRSMDESYRLKIE